MQLLQFLNVPQLDFRRGRYSLSSRTLLELQTYLKANYEDDIHECTICLELLTKGIGCYTRQCGARLHAHCYKRFARESKVQCPSCKADWSDKKQLQMIGEDAIRDGQDSVAVTKRTREDYIDDDSEELAEDEETSEESEPQAESGSKGKAKSKAKYAYPLLSFWVLLNNLPRGLGCLFRMMKMPILLRTLYLIIEYEYAILLHLYC